MQGRLQGYGERAAGFGFRGPGRERRPQRARAYSGIGYTTSGVRPIPLVKEGSDYVEPTYENVASGQYPLSRFLFVYVNKEPNKALDPLTKEFLKFVLSKEGQEIVVKDGYYPMSAKLVNETGRRWNKRPSHVDLRKRKCV